MEGGRRRGALYAGAFYPKDSLELEGLVERSFTHPMGPGRYECAAGEEILALLAPHGPYNLVAPVMAHVYCHITPGPGTVYLVIGPNHVGVGPDISVMPAYSIETPLGVVSVDEEVSEALENLFPGARIEGEPHEFEFCVELQLPFLQYKVREPRIAGVLIKGSHDPRVLAAAVEELMSSARVLPIFTANLTEGEEPRASRELDMELIARIERGEVDPIARDRYPTCGTEILRLFTALAVRLKANVKTLSYTHYSGSKRDKTPRYHVGYAGFSLSRPA